MEGKATFRNNNLNFIVNDFLNINSELKFNFDFLQNTHQGSLNVKKIQYKSYFLENIKYKWEYNKQNFNGHILSECDILKCNLIHDYLFFWTYLYNYFLDYYYYYYYINDYTYIFHIFFDILIVKNY